METASRSYAWLHINFSIQRAEQDDRQAHTVYLVENRVLCHDHVRCIEK